MPDATMTPVAVVKMMTIYAHIMAVVITQLPTFHRSWCPDPRRRPNEHAENHAAQRVAVVVAIPRWHAYDVEFATTAAVPRPVMQSSGRDRARLHPDGVPNCRTWKWWHVVMLCEWSVNDIHMAAATHAEAP